MENQMLRDALADHTTFTSGGGGCLTDNVEIDVAMTDDEIEGVTVCAMLVAEPGNDDELFEAAKDYLACGFRDMYGVSDVLSLQYAGRFIDPIAEDARSGTGSARLGCSVGDDLWVAAAYEVCPITGNSVFHVATGALDIAVDTVKAVMGTFTAQRGMEFQTVPSEVTRH